MTAGKPGTPVILVNGFAGVAQHVKNLTFQNLVVPEKAGITVRDAEHVRFINVRSVTGDAPQYDTSKPGANPTQLVLP